MSKVSVSTPAGYAANDASYRIWGLAISTLMTDAGLTKTADTGQIDWSTVLKPTTTNTLVGYEIRKLVNSTLGDIYFRIEYRSGTNSSGNNSFLRISCGSTTDGAGNISGGMPGNPGFDTLYQGSSARSNTTNFTSYCFVDEGTFVLALNPANSSGTNFYNDLFIFARTSDSDGTYNNNGALILYNGTPTAQTYFRYWSIELNILAAFTTTLANPVCSVYPYSLIQASIEYETNGVVSVMEHLTPSSNWHKNVVAVNAADAPGGAELSAIVLGEEHTYLSLGVQHVGIFGGSNGNNSNVKGSLAILWD